MNSVLKLIHVKLLMGILHLLILFYINSAVALKIVFFPCITSPNFASVIHDCMLGWCRIAIYGFECREYVPCFSTC